MRGKMAAFTPGILRSTVLRWNQLPNPLGMHRGNFLRRKGVSFTARKGKM